MMGLSQKWLNRLADFLKRPAEKTVETLYAIVGSVVSTILRFLGKAVGFVTYIEFCCFCCRLSCVMVNEKSKEPKIRQQFKILWSFWAIYYKDYHTDNKTILARIFSSHISWALNLSGIFSIPNIVFLKLDNTLLESFTYQLGVFLVSMETDQQLFHTILGLIKT